MMAALAAAWLLVLQSTFGAFAFGVEPSAGQLDAFGNVICTHDGASQLPNGDPHQQHMPTCCVLGCSVASAVHAPPLEAGTRLASPSFEVIAFVFPAPRHLDFARDYSPANPRAPPLVA